LLFQLLKIPATWAIHLYCRQILIDRPEALREKGPLLIAANHPNSFLDAIILSTLFKQPIYSLARGDAFTNRFTSALLRSLNILPVYRISEGAENLEQNYQTFDACRSIFQQGGIVLIFSEGLCINEWKLRPLKKGTARLSISSWENNIPLRVLPAGINYHSYHRFGKQVRLSFGNPITAAHISLNNGYGKAIQDFNQQLRSELEPLVLHCAETDDATKAAYLVKPMPAWKEKLCFVPAILGYVLHAPLYWPVKQLTRRKALGTGHYDSILVGLLFLLYPIYLLLWVLLIGAFAGCCGWMLLPLLFPMLAYCTVQWRHPFPGQS
jgi:1-acyl-sn-glycerol-3-phosphate acyltransferase